MWICLFIQRFVTNWGPHPSPSINFPTEEQQTRVKLYWQVNDSNHVVLKGEKCFTNQLCQFWLLILTERISSAGSAWLEAIQCTCSMYSIATQCKCQCTLLMGLAIFSATTDSKHITWANSPPGNIGLLFFFLADDTRNKQVFLSLKRTEPWFQSVVNTGLSRPSSSTPLLWQNQQSRQLVARPDFPPLVSCGINLQHPGLHVPTCLKSCSGKDVRDALTLFRPQEQRSLNIWHWLHNIAWETCSTISKLILWNFLWHMQLKMAV